MDDSNYGPIGSVVLLVIIAVVYLVFSSYTCTAKWADSGYKSEWSLMAGCRVQDKDGRWKPEDMFRVIEGNKP